LNATASLVVVQLLNDRSLCERWLATIVWHRSLVAFWKFEGFSLQFFLISTGETEGESESVESNLIHHSGPSSSSPKATHLRILHDE
jgi:hypothetical protein